MAAVEHRNRRGGPAGSRDRGAGERADPRCWVAPGAEGLGLLPGTGEPRPDLALAALFAAEPALRLRRMPGRETLLWRGVDGALLVVKRFRGGEARERLREALRGEGPRSPARREIESLRALAAAGLPVPRPLAWLEEPGPEGRSAAVMEAVRASADLRAVLERAPAMERRGWLDELASLVARLHALGWYHRDLYLEHVLVAGERAGGSPLVLIDAGRARREDRPRRRWFVKDVAALLHSAPAALGRRERLYLLARYLDRRGIAGRRARRSFAAAALSKARRMAAHAPRHADPESARAAAWG